MKSRGEGLASGRSGGPSSRSMFRCGFMPSDKAARIVGQGGGWPRAARAEGRGLGVQVVDSPPAVFDAALQKNRKGLSSNIERP